MKLSTYKASSEYLQKIGMITPPTSFGILPFGNFEYWKTRPSVTLKLFDIFSFKLYKYGASSDDTQRTSTITPPPTIIQNYYPMKILNIGNRIRSITQKTFRCFYKTLHKYKASSDNEQRTTTITLSTFLRSYAPLNTLNNENIVPQ